MKFPEYIKDECLRQAVEIAKAYAQSGENKHGPITDFIEQVYKKLLELKTSSFGEDLEKDKGS